MEQKRDSVNRKIGKIIQDEVREKKMMKIRKRA